MVDTRIKTFACTNYLLDTLKKYSIGDVTNLKLQKLIYFAFGIHATIYDEKLFQSDIEAWKLGPVVPIVYHSFKKYGLSPITDGLYVTDEANGETFLVGYDSLSEGEERSLSIACLSYGREKAWKLVDITHEKKSAWSKAYKDGVAGIVIEYEDVKEEFKGYTKELASFLK
jgi:uncharacterized phage-associated protein